MRGVVFNLGGEGGNMAQLILFYFFSFCFFSLFIFYYMCILSSLPNFYFDFLRLLSFLFSLFMRCKNILYLCLPSKKWKFYAKIMKSWLSHN